MPISPTELMRKLNGKPAYVSADALQTNRISKEDMKMLMQYGLTGNQLSKLLSDQLVVNYDRQSLYRECDRAQTHWLMGAAMELYADVSTNFNRLHNASLWVTSEDTRIENELNRLLESIGAEEKIFDWAWSVATYGDLWAKLNIHPDLGVIAIDDGAHPIEVSRVDNNGRLLGFFHTPLGYNVQDGGKLLPPWEYVHFRLLGTKRRRPMLNDPSYGEFRTASIMAPETRRASVQYGSSLMTQALPNYKRLRMSEDCLLMARASKGVLRYLYKLRVDGANSDAILEMIDEITNTLKRARALDTSNTSTKYDEKSNEFAVMEDIVMPVWGDAKNDLVVEKLGGEPDIRWITDIESLTNQTASALRTPLQLLGGYMKDMPSGLNTSAIENVDIRFARSCRRVQRSIITAVTRICQVHLALRGMIPDAKMFEVHMAETSTAEEKELMESLDKGVDVAGKVIEMFDNVATLGREEKIDLLNYLNTKILKLDDLDISALCSKVAVAPENKVDDVIRKELKDRKNHIRKESKKAPLSTEFFAHLPIKNDMLVESNAGKQTYKIRNAQWESCYGNCKVEMKTVADKYVDTDGKTHDIKRQVESLVGVNL